MLPVIVRVQEEDSDISGRRKSLDRRSRNGNGPTIQRYRTLAAQSKPDLIVHESALIQLQFQQCQPPVIQQDIRTYRSERVVRGRIPPPPGPQVFHNANKYYLHNFAFDLRTRRRQRRRNSSHIILSEIMGTEIDPPVQSRSCSSRKTLVSKTPAAAASCSSHPGMRHYPAADSPRRLRESSPPPALRLRTIRSCLERLRRGRASAYK